MASRITWAERLEQDPSLRAFVEAEIARAGIDLQVLRIEAGRWQRAAERLDEQLKEARKGRDARRVNRDRQLRHRRRHAFLHPVAESSL
jgi:hypothetical protein